MHKLWRPRHTHALAVGTEVEFYCLSHPALQTYVLKCNQNGAWRITHETKENIQRCNRYGKQDVTQHVGVLPEPINILKTNIINTFLNAKHTHSTV